MTGVKKGCGMCYLDALPVHTSPLVDDLATAPSGPVIFALKKLDLMME